MKRTGSLIVVGTGIKGVAHMTMETRIWIEQADKVLYCVGDVSTERWIKRLNPTAESLYVFYGDDKLRMQSYNQMVDRILECVREGVVVCAAFYGHPGVFVYPSHESIRRARLEGYSAMMLPGVSSDACLFADLDLDPSRTGCLSLEATDYLVRKRKLDPTVAVILWQAGCVGDVGFKSTGFDGRNIPLLAEALQEQYGQDYEVIVYEAPQYAVCNSGIRRVTLSKLTEARLTGISTIYIPPKEKSELDRDMMKRLGLKPRPKSKNT